MMAMYHARDQSENGEQTSSPFRASRVQRLLVRLAPSPYTSVVDTESAIGVQLQRAARLHRPNDTVVAFEKFSHAPRVRIRNARQGVRITDRPRYGRGRSTIGNRR